MKNRSLKRKSKIVTTSKYNRKGYLVASSIIDLITAFYSVDNMLDKYVRAKYIVFILCQILSTGIYIWLFNRIKNDKVEELWGWFATITKFILCAKELYNVKNNNIVKQTHSELE